jgi:hypothetical protein
MRRSILWIMQFGTCGIGKCHDLCSPGLFILVIFRFESSSLALKGVGNGGRSHPKDVVHNPTEVRIGV